MTTTSENPRSSQKCDDAVRYSRGTDLCPQAQDDGQITLEDILKPCDHSLIPGKVEAANPPLCAGCEKEACEYRCPYIACRFDVCAECWNLGLRAHVVQLGGNGPKVQRDTIIQHTRSSFAKTDVDRRCLCTG